MKFTAIITAAALALSMGATAGHADDLNAGLEKRLIRSNVPVHNGSAPGFLLTRVGFFASETIADQVGPDVHLVPADVDVRDLGEVTEYLNSIGYTNFAPVIDTQGDGTVRRRLEPDFPGQEPQYGTFGKKIPTYRQRW